MDSKQLLIFEAARLCYEFNLSQQEVAEILNLSPATLTRLLKKARELGIIKISVQPPEEYAKDLGGLSDTVKEKLGLDEVMIVPSSNKIEIIRKELGFATGRWLSSVLSNGMTIGFSGGRSVTEAIPFLKKSFENIQVVQLMGGVSPTEKEIQADVIARKAATQLGGVCHVLHGPAIFPDEATLTQLLKSSIVADVAAHFDSLDISIVGIGTLNSDNPLIQCGFLKEDELEHLRELGCVGDICGHFFNQDGIECDPSLACRILGIHLEQLVNTPKVCAVAAGSAKIPAIIAACRAKIPKTLVTDVNTATELVKRK